ncbi:MAG: MFS transporter [Dehalococcoidales bacterium]|nr:MFS transporter [Dehalococcoidales bacterium]
MTSEKAQATNKGVVLVVTATASFLAPLMVSSVNIALPSIGAEFKLDAVTLNWVATAYLLACAVVLVPMGRIADIYGRKRIFSTGVIIYTIASLLSAVSTSASMLIAFRVVQGIGAAMIFGTATAILTSVFDVGERGKALGINVAVVYIGLSAGPPIGGLLTEQFGWRSIFYANLIIGVIIIAGFLWRLKGEWAGARGEKFDIAGSVIYGLALIGLMSGLSRLPDVSGFWLVITGILLLIAFVWWEIRVKSPVLNIGLFRNNTVFSLSNAAALVNYSATYAVGFLTSLYLQYIKGLNPETAGFVLIAMPAMQAILSPFTGRLSDKVEPRTLASAGMGLTCAGLIALIFLNQDTSLWFVMAALALLGIGFGLFSSPNTNAIMSAIDKKYYGVGSGILSTMRVVGQMMSMGIVLLLFAVYIGRAEINPALYPVFLKTVRVAFIIFAALCFGGVFASLARGKTH